MLDMTKMRLATEPDRPMTETEKQYYSDRMPSIEFTATITIPTNRGGHLKLGSEGGYVDVLVDGIGKFGLRLRYTTEHFQSLLEGGCEHLPAVGMLVFTPRGRDRVRLCLVPERGATKIPQHTGFEVDLVNAEILAKL